MGTLIIFLLCAIIVFVYLSNKDNEVARLKEQLREQKNLSASRIEPTLPTARKFVSVSFKEGDSQLYDYFVGDNYDLKIGDRVEVPFHSKYTGKNEVKIATVKYVSSPGEQSYYAGSNVIRKIDIQPQFAKKSPSDKRFVQVIFEKDDEKSYSYLLGDFEVKVGDFVVVNTKDKNSGQSRLRSAQIIYISEPGEVSQYAKSKIIKKAANDKW